MRIFTKVKFVFFKPGEERKEKNSVVAPARGFTDVGDWVKKDPTFRAGIKAELIEVLETREKQLKAENKAAGVNPDGDEGEEAKAKAANAKKKKGKAAETGENPPESQEGEGNDPGGEKEEA